MPGSYEKGPRFASNSYDAVVTESAVNKSAEVDAYMVKLEHPLKAEVQAVREIIKGVNPGITEQIKWNAPSFSYRGEYLVTFNLRSANRVRLVWHNPAVANIKSELLEGDYKDRRMSYLASMADVKSMQMELVRVVQELVAAVEAVGSAPTPK